MLLDMLDKIDVVVFRSIIACLVVLWVYFCGYRWILNEVIVVNWKQDLAIYQHTYKLYEKQSVISKSLQ